MVPGLMRVMSEALYCDCKKTDVEGLRGGGSEAILAGLMLRWVRRVLERS